MPDAASVFRSACTPAPPLGSLPAIVRTACGMVLEFCPMQPTLLAFLTAGDQSRALRIGERVGACVLITVLTAIAAQISIPLPFTPVPFTFQPMVVLVGAAALGARLGMASQMRSEERRVGKECRSRWSPYH